MKTHTAAPRRLRRKKVGVSTSLPPGAAQIVDDQIGTFIGDTRADVLRFIITSWITEHYAALTATYAEKR